MWNQFLSNLFSKFVAFTKFLSRKCDSNFHTGHNRNFFFTVHGWTSNFKPSKKVLFMQIRHEMYHEKVNLLHFCLGWVVSIMLLLYWYFEEYMVSLYHLAIKSGFYGAVKNFERTVKLTLFFLVFTENRERSCDNYSLKI